MAEGEEIHDNSNSKLKHILAILDEITPKSSLENEVVRLVMLH